MTKEIIVDRKWQSKTFIEILVSAIKLESYSNKQVPRQIFHDYLEINDKKSTILLDLRNEYDGISKDYFKKKVESADDFKKSLVDKIESFERICRRTRTKTLVQFEPTIIINSDTQSVCDFYNKRTGQNSVKPFRIYSLPEEEVPKFDSFCTEIGKESLELEIISDVEDHLSLKSYYSSKKLKVVDKCADACWSLYNELSDFGNKEIDINRQEFRNKILQRFHIRSYAKYEPAKAKKKIKDAVSQWIRDVKKNNNIKIQK